MLVIRSGRHPHEALFLVFVAIAGLSGLFAPGETANSLLRQMPPVALALFYAVLATGSLTALIGAYSRGMKGPVIEAYGLGIITFELFGYGVAVFAYAGLSGLFSALFPLCMAAANVWRMFQVRGEYKAAKAFALAGRSAGES